MDFNERDEREEREERKERNERNERERCESTEQTYLSETVSLQYRSLSRPPPIAADVHAQVIFNGDEYVPVISLDAYT